MVEPHLQNIRLDTILGNLRNLFNIFLKEGSRIEADELAGPLGLRGQSLERWSIIIE